jgi:hypothetical protein
MDQSPNGIHIHVRRCRLKETTVALFLVSRKCSTVLVWEQAARYLISIPAGSLIDLPKPDPELVRRQTGFPLH